MPSPSARLSMASIFPVVSASIRQMTPEKLLSNMVFNVYLSILYVFGRQHTRRLGPKIKTICLKYRIHYAKFPNYPHVADAFPKHLLVIRCLVGSASAGGLSV